MITILGAIALFAILFWPTLVSTVRNGWYTTLCIFCLNIMLVLVSITIPVSDTVLDMFTNFLWIVSFYLMILFVPHEKDPKSLTYRVGKV